MQISVSSEVLWDFLNKKKWHMKYNVMVSDYVDTLHFYISITCDD